MKVNQRKIYLSSYNEDFRTELDSSQTLLHGEGTQFIPQKDETKEPITYNYVYSQ